MARLSDEPAAGSPQAAGEASADPPCVERGEGKALVPEHGCTAEGGGGGQPDDDSPGGRDDGGGAGAEPSEGAGPAPSEIFALVRQESFEVASKLLKDYPKHWQSRDDDGHSLLHWAALVGNSEFAQTALAQNIPVDAQARNLQTPLMWAVLRGHCSTARLLLESKANVRASDSLLATPLIIAIQHGKYQAMLLLINRGNDVLLNDADNKGCVAAHWAAYKGDVTALKFLDYFGADLQALDHSKMLPLHRATLASQPSAIEFLLEKRSDPNTRNADGKSCVEIAQQQNDKHITLLFDRMRKAKDGINGLDLEVGRGEAVEKEKGVKGVLKALYKDRSMHKVFPVFWLVCVSLATFEYIMDLRSTAWSVAPTMSFVFEFGVPLSLSAFACAALMDPGKLPAKTRGASGVEELMRHIDAPGEPTVDMSRLCTTTWVLKGLRTKYCAQTGACIEEFDHYCIWLNCAIGKGNHRMFILLALVEFVTQVAHLYLIWSLTGFLVTYESFGSWLYGVLTGYPLLFLIGLAHFLTAPFVLMLVLHQSRLVGMNLTTNEMLNVQRYEHFWIYVPGQMMRQYRNPFNKGNVWKNCLDFWWTRERSEAPLLHLRPTGCSKGCCHKHP